eukprot:1942559-Prymnesium_polylepis.1
MGLPLCSSGFVHTTAHASLPRRLSTHEDVTQDDPTTPAPSPHLPAQLPVPVVPSPCGTVLSSSPPYTRPGHRALVARPARTGSPTRHSPSRATRAA